jgi:hypothetical protein
MPTARLCYVAVLVFGSPVAFACSEPSDEPAELPVLVFAQRGPTGLSSIMGYWEGEGVREIAPALVAPRPSDPYVLVRPITGELLYYSLDPDHSGYVLVDPTTHRVRRLAVPGGVQEWSPTGDLLTTWRGDSQWVVTVDGAIRATFCGPDDGCGLLKWTAGGDAVILSRRNPGGGPFDLWAVPLGGGPEINLTQTDDASEGFASYSPDGRQLVYYRQPGGELIVSNADGSEARPLIAEVTVGTFPWSPDGAAVAVDAGVAGQFGLVLVPLQGAPYVLAPERLFSPSRLAWSPEGDRLAYVAWDAADTLGVFLINIDGGGRRRLSTPGNEANSPAWMPGQR